MDQNQGISIKDRADDLDLQRIENDSNQNKKQESCEKLKEKIFQQNAVSKRWTNTERVRFLTFLTNYKSILESNNRIEKHGIFSKMSTFIETKNREACKTWYKQFFRRYRSVYGTIIYLKKIIHFNLEEIKMQGQRMRQFIKKEREKQYNAVRGYNSKDFIMQNKPTFQFQPIISKIKLSSKQNKQKNDIGQEDTQTNNNNQLNLQIPREVVLIIQKKPSNNNGKEQNEQNQQKNNRFQSADDQKAVKRRNYLMVDNSDCKDIFQQQNMQINKASIRKKIKEQDLEKSHSQQNDQIIYEESESQQILQQPDQQEINQQKNYQYAQKQQDKLSKKKNGSNIWTMSERMRIIIFIYINKQFFQSTDRIKKGILSKLCRYIGTDKTPDQCQTRLHYYRRKYNHNIARIIGEQTQLLGISQDQIEKEREKIESMNDSEEPIMRCDIKIKAETIIHKTNIKVTDFDKNQIIRQLFDLQLPLSVELNIVQQKSHDDRKESSNKLELKQQSQSKSKLLSYEQKEKEIYYESNSQQINKSKDQNIEHEQINEVIIQQIKQEDSLISNCQYHGQKNINCVRSKITIYVNSKIFQMLKISMKEKSQKQEKFSLVNETNHYIIAEIKLKQLVKVVFTSKLSQNDQQLNL